MSESPIQDMVAAAARLGIDEATVIAFVSRRIGHNATRSTPGRDDARMRPYRARVRLYAARDGFTEPQADTDPDLPADVDGATTVHGLAAVADLVYNAAQDFHHAQAQMFDAQAPVPAMAGLDMTSLRKRLAGLRVSLSRSAKDNGESRGVWRLRYTVGEDGAASDWIARVDVVRR